MRTTITLDDDVAARLKAESRRPNRPFREIVNETLRRGLEGRRATPKRRGRRESPIPSGACPILSPGR
jgi:hypothetical protein